MLGKLDSYLWKNEIRTLTNTIHKDNSKWIKKKTLNVRPETMKKKKKLLEENIGRTLWHKSQQDPLWSTSQSNENKNKQTGPN